MVCFSAYIPAENAEAGPYLALISIFVALSHTPEYTDIPGRRALRSAVTDRLAVPSVHLHSVGNRAFPVAARSSGTVCQTTSYLLHLSLPSAAY